MYCTYLLGLIQTVRKAKKLPLPEVIKPLRSIKEVDKVLLLYISTIQRFKLNSDKAKYAKEELGFNQHQLAASLTRLVKKEWLVLKDNEYLINARLSKDNNDSVPPIVPFNSDEFLTTWDEYLLYRVAEHDSPLRSNYSQTRAMHKLARDVGNNEQLAIDVLNETMDNNWIGLVHGLKSLAEKADTRAARSKVGKGQKVSDIITNRSRHKQ
jgi:hypothetical protein